MADEKKKLAVFFPGIGYTNDKPLMHYTRKILKELGYEILLLDYHDLPTKGDMTEEKMKKAIDLATMQSEEKIGKVDLQSYDEVLFVGKSLGTVLATIIADKLKINARLILFTPVEASFSVKIKDAIAFIGTNDPWSVLDNVIVAAKEHNIPLYQYENCNHSLETPDVLQSIEVLEKVMAKVIEYIA